MSRLRGLDVSSCQFAIDYLRVPAEFAFVIVKVSEGETGMDPMRERNLKGARDSGRFAAIYHFMRSAEGAEAQVENMWKAAGATMPAFTVLDFETIKKGLESRAAVDKADAIGDGLQARFGRVGGLYMFPAFGIYEIGLPILAQSRLGRFWLDMADYRGGEDPPPAWKPFTPDPWKDWTMCQTSGNGSSRVPGIVGAVDHQILNGGVDVLRCISGLPAVDPPEPPMPIVHPLDFDARDLDFDEDT